MAAVGAGCGAEGEAAEEQPPEQVSTTRRSNNENSCEQLRVVDGIKDRTAELSGALAGAVRGGRGGPEVLEAAHQLATHLSDSAPAVAEAYAEAAAWAPASAAAAIEALAASYASGASGLIGLLRATDSGDDIAMLVATLGVAAGVPPEEIEPGAAEEVDHYISVICGIV